MKNIDEREWKKMKVRLAHFPSDASRRVAIKSLGGEITHCYLLHMACMRQPPTSIVVTLLDAFIDANSKKDTMLERLPIHYACQFGASLEVIMLLVSKNPNVIKSSGKDGSLPLHLACEYISTSKEVVHYLIQKYPKALRIKNKNDKFPSNMVTSKEIKMILRKATIVEQKSYEETHPLSSTEPYLYTYSSSRTKEIKRNGTSNMRRFRLKYSNVA